MNKELILKNKYKVIYMPKTKAKAFENIKSGDVIEITLPLTHKRSGDNNSLIAYYPIINSKEKVGIPTIKKLIEKGMVLEELKNSDTYVETLSKENQELKNQLEKSKNRYINRLNNLLAEDVEPDEEDFYFSEIENKANAYDKLLKKQEEFIKYLEDESKEIYRDGGLRQNIFKQVLQKYKNILDYKDEQN